MDDDDKFLTGNGMKHEKGKKGKREKACFLASGDN